MVVLEAGMPSGFLVDKDKLAGLLRAPHIKLVETKRGETQANIYIDQMIAEEELCVTVHGYRSHQVAETKPVAVKIYDYYDSCKHISENAIVILLHSQTDHKINNCFIYLVFI